MCSDLYYDTDQQLRPPLQVPSTHVHSGDMQQLAHPPERFTFEMGSTTTDKKKFLMTLRDELIAKGHSIRNVSGLS